MDRDDDDFTYFTHEQYGLVTLAQLHLYGQYNVSVEDHKALTGVYGEDDEASGCHARVAIITEVRRCSENGTFNRELMYDRARQAGII